MTINKQQMIDSYPKLDPLFDEIEGYTELGVTVADKVYAFLQKMMSEYPNMPCRDFRCIVQDQVDNITVFAIADRRHDAGLPSPE